MRRYSDATGCAQLAAAAGFRWSASSTSTGSGPLAWFLNGSVLRRRTFGLLQIQLLNLLTPLFCASSTGAAAAAAQPDRRAAARRRPGPLRSRRGGVTSRPLRVAVDLTAVLPGEQRRGQGADGRAAGGARPPGSAAFLRPADRARHPRRVRAPGRAGDGAAVRAGGRRAVPAAAAPAGLGARLARLHRDHLRHLLPAGLRRAANRAWSRLRGTPRSGTARPTRGTAAWGRRASTSSSALHRARARRAGPAGRVRRVRPPAPGSTRSSSRPRSAPTATRCCACSRSAPTG